MTDRITDTERRLLENVFTDTACDGQKTLYIHQEEALHQLRIVMRFLEDKYPDTKFRYRMFDPYTRMSERGELLFSAGAEEEPYKAFLRPDGSGYRCTDTLYGCFVREAYDSALSALLSSFAAPVRTHTDFYTPADERLDAHTTVQKLIAYEPVITRHTDLYVREPFTLSEELTDSLRKEGLLGSYSVYLVNDPLMYKKNMHRQLCLNFTVFDREYSEGETQ